MNQYSIDALRREHHLFVYEDRMTGDDVEACDVCGDGYPCDVIFVLDAWEAEKAKENESAPKYYRWDDAKQLNKEIDCDHTDENGLCWCKRGSIHCPDCRGWLDLSHHAKKQYFIRRNADVVTDSASVSATWLGSCPHQADSRLLPGLDLTTEIATSVVEECECGEEL